MRIAVNKTVYNVTKSLDNFQYNVVIANIHEIFNLFHKHVMENKTSNTTLKNEWEKITMLLMPLTPHLAHECCEKIIQKFYWPKYDPELFEDELCKIVIQIDGKKREILEIQIDMQEKDLINEIKKNIKVKKFLENKEINRVIFVKNKLINLITK